MSSKEKRDPHWVIVSAGLLRHKKLAALSKRLNIPRYAAQGIVIGVWQAAYVQGDLGDIAPDDLAHLLYYKDDAEQLVDALCESGFLDRLPDGSLAIHNWEYYSGLKKTKERSMQRQYQREKRKQSQNDTVAEQSDNVASKSDTVADANDSVAQKEEIERKKDKSTRSAKREQDEDTDRENGVSFQCKDDGCHEPVEQEGDRCEPHRIAFEAFGEG